MKRSREQLIENVKECSRIFLGQVKGAERVEYADGTYKLIKNMTMEELDARENYFIDMVQNSTRGISVDVQLKAKAKAK